MAQRTRTLQFWTGTHAGTKMRRAVASDWLARGFSCDIWTDSPGQVWSDFVHATDELVMLIEGELELTCNGVTRQIAVGEEVLIPAGVAHTVRNTGQTTNRWYYGYRREE